jgi:hypothetical protein
LSDLIIFLTSQGITGYEELEDFIHRFVDNPSIFFELDEFEREEIEEKMDQLLEIIKNV